MPKSLAGALAESKSQGVYGKWNAGYIDSHAVDPDDLPDWVEAKKPQPEPTTLEKIQNLGTEVGEKVNEVSGEIVDTFRDRTDAAAEQAQQDYTNYQNDTPEQPVGLSGMVNAVKNTSLSDIGNAIADANNSRAQEYQEQLNDFQNPVQAPQGIENNWLANAPEAAADSFLNAGLLGSTYGPKVRQQLAFTADFVKSTELYNNFNFMWGTPEKNHLSEELGRAFGVDSAIFFNDRDAYINGARLLANFKTDSRLGNDVDRNDPEAFRQYLREYYPAIAGNNTPDTFADKLKNAEDVKQISSIFRIPQLVYDVWANTAERNDIYRNAYMDRRYLTDEEVERAQALSNRLNELNKKIPQITEHPLYGVLTQTAVQFAGMGTDSAVGAVAAGVAGLGVLGATGNPAAARTAAGYGFKVGSMAGMFARQVGEKYVEYLSYQNKDDTRTLTPNQAALAATIETGVETGIEFWNFNNIMRTLGGRDRAAIQDIVRENHGNAEAIRGGLKGYLESTVKAWAPRAKEEVLEEAYQSATSDITHNAIVALHPETKEQYIPLADITANSVDAMVQAVPSVVGMIAGGDIISNIRMVRNMASIYELHKNMTEEEINNAELNSILKDVQENQKTSKLAKENPRAYMQVLKTEADKAGIPNVYVDTEMLMKEPGGREVLEKLGEQSGYTKDQVQETINSKGDLEVPTSVFCQVALPSSVGDKVIDMATSSPDINSQARVKDTINRIARTARALAEQDEKEIKEIIPTIVENNFQSDEERQLATEIISKDPGHINKAYQDTVRDTERELNDILQGTIDIEEADSKEGDTVARTIRNENLYNGQITTTKGAKRRNQFWTDYFGSKTPTQAQKRQYAYDVLTGAVKGGPRSLGVAYDMAMQNGDTKEASQIKAEMQANKAKLDGLQHNLDVLKGMKDKLGSIPSIETTITRGLTPEGYRVYQRTTGLLSSSTNKKVQQAARYDGVLFARMCQRLAEEWTRQGKKTTAEDVAKGLNIVPAGGVADGGFNQPVTNPYIDVDTLVPVLDVTNLEEVNVNSAYEKKNIAENLIGKTFQILGSDKEGKVASVKSGKHLVGGSRNPLRTDSSRKKAVSILDKVLSNSVYVEKHPDGNHGTDNDYIELFAAIRDGQKIRRLRIVAKEKGSAGNFDIEDAQYYDVIVEKGAIATHLPNGSNSRKTPSNTITIADLLNGVNDKSGVPYLNSNGEMNYANGIYAVIGHKVKTVIANGNQGYTYASISPKFNQTAWHGSPYDFEHFDLGAMGSGEGNQVHGWGLYFAQNREISEAYKDTFGYKGLAVDLDGKRYTQHEDGTFVANDEAVAEGSSLDYALNQLIDSEGDKDVAVKELREAAKRRANSENEAVKKQNKDFVQAADLLEKINNVNVTKGGKLYEVNVPENDVLLDEQSPLFKQPLRVLKGLSKLNYASAYTAGKLANVYDRAISNDKQHGTNTGVETIKNYLSDVLNRFASELPTDETWEKLVKALHGNEELAGDVVSLGMDSHSIGMPGKDVYDEISEEYNSAENASRALNEAGVTGITYSGRRDGRCFVVFDDKAISIIDKYNQQQAQIQGQTTVTGDMISLFDAADQSTFMHESAHWYLINMQKLALNENASRQFVEDFMTLQQWFGNKKLDADISVEQHEKFARGFEAYLRTGKAPAPQLHGIFNRFKSWLTSIYRDFKQLGGKPTKEVSAVMDRMLATQDEIDRAMKEQMVDDFKRAGGLKTMNGENARTWERWYQKVRQEAEAKVMAQAMKDLTEADQKDIQGAIDAQRAVSLEEMKRDPFWIADEAYRAIGDESILATFNLTPQEYTDELKKRGGSMKAALDSRMQGFEKEMRESAKSTDNIAEEAKEAVQSSEYQEMLHALEYEALAQKAREYVRQQDEKARKAQDKQDRQTARENAKAEADAEKARKVGEKLTMQEEKRNAKVKAAQAEVEGVRKGMRIVRDTVLKTLQERRAAAKAAMAKLPINQATNVALWARKLGQKQNDVYNYMTRGRWDLAAAAKQDQLMMAAMVTESGRLKVQIDRQAANIQKRIQVLQKGTERMPTQARFWYQHIAYVLGLSRGDGLNPAEGAKSLQDVFNEMTGLDQNGAPEVLVPQWLNSMANQTGRIGMGKLSPDQWSKAVEIMKALYKMGMDKDQLHVVSADGVNPTISETAQALAANMFEHNGRHPQEDVRSENTFLDKRRQNLRDAKEYTGSFFTKLINPLTVMQRMDGYEGKVGRSHAGMAIKTLYDPVERATNAEIKLMAAFAEGLKNAFGKYTGEELDDLHNKRIYRFGDRLLTKEEIMCLALTSGTESGYKRILDNEIIGDQEFSSLVRREAAVADALQDVLSNLDERDWNTVTAVWNLMGSHYADESGVKERTTGIPLGKLKHRQFSVTGKDGKAYMLQGGYYPVAYDASKTARASDLETQDALRSMAPGNMRMGQGKGFTKSRERIVTGRPLKLSFDTISNKGAEMMHYIAFRETALDVNHIINNRGFAQAIVDSMGMDEYHILQQWASDIWQAPKESQAVLDRIVRSVRTKTTSAVLAYRTSTMLLNAANASLMAEHVGATNFLNYVRKFYAEPEKNWRFVNGISPFMAERSERMDTNLREAMEKSQLTVQGKSGNPVLHGIQSIHEAIMDNGFKLIGLTDNMFAYPLWYGSYIQTLNEELQAGKTNAEAQKQAIAAGDRAVIRVIGSGEMKDLSQFQKGSELARTLTMFYSFQNALYNMLANKYYAGVQNAELAGKTGWRRFTSPEFIAPMAHHLLVGVMMGAAVETAIRGAMDAMSGGDDDKKKDAAYWLTRYAETAAGNQLATIPLVRDIWRPISQAIFYPKEPFSLQKDRAKMTSAYDAFIQMANAGVTLRGATLDKKGMADIIREGGRAINRMTGNPDMITDGVANAIDYFTSPEQDRDIKIFIGKTLMDKKYPKNPHPKKKKNAAKKRKKKVVK